MVAVIFCSILFLLTRTLRLLILTVDFQLTSVRLCLTKPACCHTAANLTTYLLPTINLINLIYFTSSAYWLTLILRQNKFLTKQRTSRSKSFNFHFPFSRRQFVDSRDNQNLSTFHPYSENFISIFHDLECIVEYHSVEIFENFHVCRCKFCSRDACAALTLSCASAKINQNWNVIAERRACEFARVREPSFRRHGFVVYRASHRVSILRSCAGWPDFS